MIPITRPFVGEEEAAAARKVILSGWLTQGPKIKQFEESFASYVGSQYACAVSSCTAALHLSLLTVGVKPGDVVITVSHSFIATANVVRYCGAEPVFVDIDSVTLNISPESLNTCLTRECEDRNGALFYRDVHKLAGEESPLSRVIKNEEKTGTSDFGRVAAILVVHQVGRPCDLPTILPLARRFDIPVVEDAACAIGSEININRKWERIGKPHSQIACFSFHPRKVLTTGDGGMITTDNPDYDRQFRLFRQHGMSVPAAVRHSSKKIIFEQYITTGFNYRLTDIQAAIGIEQLKKLPAILDSRNEINRLYHKHLGDIDWLKLPEQAQDSRSNWQSYPIRLLPNSPVSRNELMQYLLDKGVSTRPGIMNAHQEKVYSNFNRSLPVSEKAREVIILFPMFSGLDERDVKRISDSVHKLD